MVIRSATWTDSMQLTVMLCKMHQEINTRKDLLEENSDTKAMFYKIISRLEDPNWIILVAEEENEYTGFVMGFIHWPIYGQCHIIGSVEAMYVYPEDRGKGVYKELIKEMQKLGKEKGVSSIEIYCINEPRILHFYDKLGYEPVQVVLRQKETI